MTTKRNGGYLQDTLNLAHKTIKTETTPKRDPNPYDPGVHRTDLQKLILQLSMMKKGSTAIKINGRDVSRYTNDTFYVEGRGPGLPKLQAARILQNAATQPLSKK